MQEIKAITSYFTSLLASETAKNVFSQQPYFTTEESLLENLSFSHEIYSYCQDFTTVGFSQTKDIRTNLKSSLKDYILDIEDIFNTHLYLQQWDMLKNLEIPREKFPLFSHYIDEIFVAKDFLHYWDNSFDTDGTIKDSASSELLRIRNLKKSLRKQIEKILSAHMKKNEDLAEQRMAFREDRYVIPLKSVAKNRHQGIVHGFSSSGLVTYLEPQEIVHLNNELLSVDDLEHQEILRLLKMWSTHIANNLDDIQLIIDRISQLEILFAKYVFARKIKGDFASLNTDNEIVLKKVYNPFLLLNKSFADVTPITIEVEKEYSGIIISGPNAGGKSASLKTLALCADMFLRGLPIPARDSSLPLFSGIFVEIGDAQNLTNDLSTFSGHMYNIQHILNNFSANSLILIDEIAHATDPVEGEALACAIIDELLEKDCFFAITTHYKQVKIKSFEHEQIKSYSAGFDTKNMKALYTLYPHTVGESYALHIAEKMGLPSSIINKAEVYLTKGRSRTEVILSNLEQHERELQQKELAIIERETEQQNYFDNLEREKQQLQEEINSLKAEGLKKADKELSYCLKELSHIYKTIAQDPKKSDKKLKEIQKIVNKKKEENTTLSRPLKTQMNIGENVYLASLDKDGIIEEIHKNSAIVRVGIIKYTVQKSDIFESTKTKPANVVKTQKQYHTEVKTELDLHGCTVEDAIPMVSRYLDRAISADLPSFTILHGKGTGALQEAVKDYLKRQPEVKKFHFATPRDGGAGKTIVYF